MPAGYRRRGCGPPHHLALTRAVDGSLGLDVGALRRRDASWPDYRRVVGGLPHLIVFDEVQAAVTDWW